MSMTKIKNFILNLNYVKAAKISMIVVIFGVFFGSVLFPRILKFIMKTQLQLKPGTQMRDMFTVIPFPLDFKVYIFNVTNPDEVSAGGKPKLQEVGPYYFEEWKVKYNLVDDDAEDTLEYDYKNTYIYNPAKNGAGLTGDEIITVPNPPLVGMAMLIKIEREELLSFINNAINGLFNNPKNIFWTGRVMDLLFDGIALDCSNTEEFEVGAACAEFESGEHKAISQFNETTYKFSMLGPGNDTNLGRFTVLRGSKDLRDLGRVLKFNGEPEMDIWDGDECNQYMGTDSTIFPPFSKKEEGFWAFEPYVCRSMIVEFDRKTKYAGIKANHFKLDLGDISADPKLHCFCRSPDKCPVQGTFDLFPCFGASITASLPHFYMTHPSVSEKVEGLNPDESKHAAYADFHQFSGTPLRGAKRLQFNMEVMPLEEIPMFNNIQEMLLPLLWVEEGVQLNKTFTNMLKYQLILALQFQDTVKYGCILGGIIGLIGAGVAYYMQSEEEERKVVPINRASSATDSVKSPDVRMVNGYHE